MEPLVFHPIEQFRTAIHIVWLIIVILVAVPLLLLALLIPDCGGQIAFSIILAVFMAIMVPVAFWITYYQRSLVYEINEKHVIMEGGVFWKRRATVPYTKVTNVDTTQGPLERYFGFGTVHVQTAGAGGAQGGKAEVCLAGIKEFSQLKDIVLKLVAETDDQIKGFTLDTSAPMDASVLERIHSELVAIRTAIERGNG